MAALSGLHSRKTKRLIGRAKEFFQAADRFRDAGQWIEAAREYRAGLQAEPGLFAYWVQLGNVSKEAGAFDEAAQAYEAALKLDDRDTDLHIQLGHLARRSGDRTAAMGHYRRALEVGGNAATEVLARAEYARESGDLHKAAAAFKTYLDGNPDAGHIWVQLGHVLRSDQRFDDAEVAYVTGIAKGADRVDGLVNLAHLRVMAGDAVGAVVMIMDAASDGLVDDERLQVFQGTTLDPALLAAIAEVRGGLTGIGATAPGKAVQGLAKLSFAQLMLLCARAPMKSQYRLSRPDPDV